MGFQYILCNANIGNLILNKRYIIFHHEGYESEIDRIAITMSKVNKANIFPFWIFFVFGNSINFFLSLFHFFFSYFEFRTGVHQ